MNVRKSYPMKAALAFAFGLTLATSCGSQQQPSLDPQLMGTGNPYLPLWEHLPDGEPRVFEDPDNPGKLRAYIIGSHDLRLDSYCGADIRMWSAPVEDLTDWRDEGPLRNGRPMGRDVCTRPCRNQTKRR